jgi:uncharacterized membrane protein
MDRMLVVVFDNAARAFEGKRALMDLDLEGSINVFTYAVLVKNADGTATVKQGDDEGPLGTIVGTSLGSFIGLLGGPTGMAIGAVAGLTAGGALDLDNARIGEDFLEDVGKRLLPGKVAVVAEVDEDWITPVDERMEAIGGIVFRRAMSEVKKTANAEEIAAMKADVAQMKAEHAKAHAGRQAKLHEKINQLESKIQAQLQKAKDRRAEADRRAQEKARLLQAKAAAANAKAR